MHSLARPFDPLSLQSPDWLIICSFRSCLSSTASYCISPELEGSNWEGFESEGLWPVWDWLVKDQLGNISSVRCRPRPHEGARASARRPPSSVGGAQLSSILFPKDKKKKKAQLWVRSPWLLGFWASVGDEASGQGWSSGKGTARLCPVCRPSPVERRQLES